jgi:hypothetical protein
VHSLADPAARGSYAFDAATALAEFGGPARRNDALRNCQRRPSKTATAFEPFFTTREVGKGTGLGLSQVYGLARQSGGTVRIQRETSAGTEVEIYVPRALGATNPEPPQAEEDMLEATVRRRGTEWVTDLVRCATCRRFAGGSGSGSWSFRGNGIIAIPLGLEAVLVKFSRICPG